MRGLKLPTMTHENLTKIIEAARSKGQWPAQLAFATTAEYASDGNIVVKHHGNPIAHIGRTWFTLSNAGWHTSTTADRLDKIITDNAPTPNPVRDGEVRFRATISDRLLVIKALRMDGTKVKQEIAQNFGLHDNAHFSRVDADHSYMLHSH